MPRTEPVVAVRAAKSFAFASAIFTLISACLLVAVIVSFATSHTQVEGCNFAAYRQLNVTCLRGFWDGHAKRWPLEFVFDMSGGISAATMIPPIMALNEIFKVHGQPSHVLVPAFMFACAIRIIELTFRAGISMFSDYAYSSFELQDQDVKSLTISFDVSMSQGLWLFAMDYLFLGVGMLAASICAFKASASMPKCWAILGVIGGTLGVLNFFLELGRLGRWTLMSEVSGLTMGVLGFIVLPVWLLILGCSLQGASDRHAALMHDDNRSGEVELRNQA